MLRNILGKFFLFSLTICCTSELLPAQPNQKKTQDLTKNKFTIQLEDKNDEYVANFIKKANNSRIIYKDGKVIFYPDPDTEQLENQMIFVAIAIFICAVTVVLIPISLILMFFEVYYVIRLIQKNNLQASMDPYLTLNDFGIKLKKRGLTHWQDIKNISKEEITTYSDGWKQSQETIFRLYDKYLNLLLKLSNWDECASKHFDKLISLIYYYLEKSNVEFTQNVQKTTITKTTRYQPVYAYR